MAYLKHAIVLIVLALTCLPAGLKAQITEDVEERKAGLPDFVDDSRRFEISLYYTLQSVKNNIHHIEGGEDTVNVGDMSRNQIEMTLSYFFTRYKTFGIELVAGYTMADGNVQDPPDNLDPDNPIIYPIRSIKHSAVNIGGNIVYQLGNLEFVPFIYAGGGVEYYDVPEESEYPFTDSYPYANIGIGLKYFHSEWLGGVMRLEDRYHFMKDDEIGSEDLNQYRLSIGAQITF